MRRGPRSARRLTAHPAPAAAAAYRPGGPVRGLAPVDPLPPAPRLSVPPRPPLPREQARALARRAWGWRALLGAWLLLMAAATWAGLRWVGPRSIGCPALMAAVLAGLAYAGSSDLREHERELRGEG